MFIKKLKKKMETNKTIKYLIAFFVFVGVFCAPAFVIKAVCAYGDVGHELGKFIYEVVDE